MMAKVKALLDGLVVCDRLHLFQIEAEIYSKVLVDWWHEFGSVHQEVREVWDRIKLLSNQINQAADCLAKQENR